MSRNNVVFALTGSSAHFFLGMGDDFNDYDVVIEYDLRADKVVMINGHIPVCPVESSLILYGMMIQ